MEDSTVFVFPTPVGVFPCNVLNLIDQHEAFPTGVGFIDTQRDVRILALILRLYNPVFMLHKLGAGSARRGVRLPGLVIARHERTCSASGKLSVAIRLV